MYDYAELIKSAMEARKNSYSPYSNFQVGAALLTEDNKIYQGCNIENVAYTPTNCAERTAFFKAIFAGERKFKAIAIVGGKENRKKTELDYCVPCGVCRQVMAEFCNDEDFEVIVAKNTQEYKVFKLKELLPYSFTIDFIK